MNEAFTWDDTIDSIAFRFSDSRLHRHCSDTVDISVILKANKKLKDDPIDLIRDLIYDTIEKSCVNTLDNSRIPLIAGELPLTTWASPIGTKTKLNSAAKVVCTLNTVAKHNLNDFVIDINCDNLQYDTEYNGTNWDHVSSIPFPSDPMNHRHAHAVTATAIPSMRIYHDLIYCYCMSA
jgi:hypothetical protein